MMVKHRLRRLYWRIVKPQTLGVRCIILSDECVLLVRHTYLAWHYLPGGGVQRGESFAQAVRREVREETGLELNAPRLLQIYYSRAEGRHDHIALYLAQHYSGTIHLDSPEIADAAFHPTDALPELTSPATRRRITEYLSGTFATEW